MLSKNLTKYLHSLQLKKYRQEHNAFLVEGAKSVLELLAADFQIELVAVTEQFYKENTSLLDKQPFRIEIAAADELSRAGTLQTNDAALAVVKTKDNEFLYAAPGEYVLVLDDIRDPGNLGTIIRIADWYGITKIICSLTTTDWYNPKVIAASKGSFTRVKGYYTELADYFEQVTGVTNAPPHPSRLQIATSVYGTFLEGKNIHKTAFADTGYIVMGNESNGISSAVEAFITQKITIPRFGGAESLNVGIAAAVVLDNWRRG
ncbi:RNA methyltransferase [Runella slithyformis]|uniref:tRNA/rRNA methyltransferase (SpoU) n=1 Tax=Runella slithyformis (strain ATCC 29530 / DSM 19594 / LMG 11500 / NCIMB 11436 / LSU 4) TaxID=761193 RepID=A0A7U3ZNF5_RUNSL|nr:RNA methyltransferase [Runella slithyformis]AEI50431.1 tRNA/rRNA methyltransferase (SpoU) [Runella slithyformis DSM 19594]